MAVAVAPAKSVAQMKQIVVNAYVNTGLTADLSVSGSDQTTGDSVNTQNFTGNLTHPAEFHNKISISQSFAATQTMLYMTNYQLILPFFLQQQQCISQSN